MSYSSCTCGVFVSLLSLSLCLQMKDALGEEAKQLEFVLMYHWLYRESI